MISAIYYSFLRGGFIPMFFVLWALEHDQCEPSKLRRKGLRIFGILWIELLVYLWGAGIYGLSIGLPFLQLAGISWNYGTYFSWLTIILMLFTATYLRTRKIILASCLSSLLAYAGGFIYEIPLLLKLEPLTFLARYVPTAQFLSIVPTAMIMAATGWHATKLFYVGLAIYVASSINYYFAFNATAMYFVRILLLPLLLSVPYGIPKAEGTVKMKRVKGG